MRPAGLALAALALAACNMMPGGPGGAPSQARQAEFVAVVEQADCRFDPADHPELHAAGFTDREMSAIGGQLVADGRAEVGEDGVLVLSSGACI